jgi:hypothetical protein
MSIVVVASVAVLWNKKQNAKENKFRTWKSHHQLCHQTQQFTMQIENWKVFHLSLLLKLPMCIMELDMTWEVSYLSTIAVENEAGGCSHLLIWFSCKFAIWVYKFYLVILIFLIQRLQVIHDQSISTVELLFICLDS